MSCQEKKTTKHIQDKPTESSMRGHRTQKLWEANRRKLTLVSRKEGNWSQALQGRMHPHN